MGEQSTGNNAIWVQKHTAKKIVLWLSLQVAFLEAITSKFRQIPEELDIVRW